MMQKRKYNNNDIIRLLVASGGRCHICNSDVMSDWRTHEPITTFEKAHIKSFSDIGPRADPSLSVPERNDASNLLILCPTHHSTIDHRIAEGLYTVEWLREKKSEKEQHIYKIMDVLNDEDCLFVKYSSTINTHNFNFTDKNIYNACFNNGFFSSEGILNLSEDANCENIEQSKALIDEKFDKRMQRFIDDGKEKTICLFARAPQPLLIYLGTKFNDKHKIAVFTSHRNLEWKYNDTSSMNSFNLIAPNNKNKENSVALVLSITANIHDERINNVLGKNVDIWRINATEIGVDKIKNQSELKRFYEICVSSLDAIGEFYGKQKEINIFSAMCNSLAITFGRSIFIKNHNNIKIYDSIKQDDFVSDVLRLSI